MRDNPQTDTPEETDPPPLLLEEQRGAILILTLNRPKTRNSLSSDLMTALGRALSEVATRKTAPKAIILQAAGPVFSAGHDLKELAAHRSDEDRGRSFYQNIMEQCAQLMQSIVALPLPVIAAVEGTATAAGCQLVASCDLAVAGAQAKFCTPGVNIGLFCSTPMVALSRNVSRKRAMEMLLLGEMISAQEAEAYGLVNRVAETGSALSVALAMAGQIAAKSAATVKIGKQAFYRQAELSLEEAYAYASSVMVENMMIKDAEEGIAAFLEKRPPKWLEQ